MAECTNLSSLKNILKPDHLKYAWANLKKTNKYLWFCLHEASKIVKFLGIEIKMMLSRAGGGENWCCLMGMDFQLQFYKKKSLAGHSVAQQCEYT